jgi:hypothetical protein
MLKKIMRLDLWDKDAVHGVIYSAHNVVKFANKA